MSARAALDLIGLLRATAADPWVDGGWGVDALLGEQTRPHTDLDVVVPDHAVPAIRAVLTAAGFRELRNWLPTTLALRHDDGREVDLHPVRRTADGGGDQQLRPPEAPFHYGPPTTGVIDGTEVRCVDPATQLRAHTGYEPQPEDRRDVQALVDRFGLSPPPGYSDLVAPRDGTIQR